MVAGLHDRALGCSGDRGVKLHQLLGTRDDGSLEKDVDARGSGAQGLVGVQFGGRAHHDDVDRAEQRVDVGERLGPGLVGEPLRRGRDDVVDADDTHEVPERRQRPGLDQARVGGSEDSGAQHCPGGRTIAGPLEWTGQRGRPPPCDNRPMRRRLRTATFPFHRHSIPQALTDGALVALAWYLAFRLRFDAASPRATRSSSTPPRSRSSSRASRSSRCSACTSGGATPASATTSRRAGGHRRDAVRARLVAVFHPVTLGSGAARSRSRRPRACWRCTSC